MIADLPRQLHSMDIHTRNRNGIGSSGRSSPVASHTPTYHLRCCRSARTLPPPTTAPTTTAARALPTASAHSYRIFAGALALLCLRAFVRMPPPRAAHRAAACCCARTLPCRGGATATLPPAACHAHAAFAAVPACAPCHCRACAPRGALDTCRLPRRAFMPCRFLLCRACRHYRSICA